MQGGKGLGNYNYCSEISLPEGKRGAGGKDRNEDPATGKITSKGDKGSDDWEVQDERPTALSAKGQSVSRPHMENTEESPKRKIIAH